MARLECDRCGRVFDADEAGLPAGRGTPGRWVSDGAQWEDGDCRHCHLCLYDECEVFLRHSRWLCGECAANRA